MKNTSHYFLVFSSLLLLGLASTAFAHEHEVDTAMDMSDMGPAVESAPNMSIDMESTSYFRHPKYASLMLAHILLMSVCWVVVLPLGIYRLRCL